MPKPGEPAALGSAPAVTVELRDSVKSDAMSALFAKAIQGGLPQAAAQELAAGFAAHVEGMGTAYLEQQQQRIAQMSEALEKHPELGGANLPQTKAMLTRLFTTAPYGRELAQVLEANPEVYLNPAVVQLLVDGARATKDDSIAGTQTGAQPTPRKEDVPLEQLSQRERWARLKPNTPYPGDPPTQRRK